MSLTRRIAHNTIIQIIGKALSLALSLVAIAAITRYLGKTGFGQFTTITAFVQTAATLIDMGLVLMMVQMISKSNIITEGENCHSRLPYTTTNLSANEAESTLISNFLGLRFISSFILLGLAILIAFLIPVYSHVIKLGIAVTSIAFLFSSLIGLLTGIFQKHLRMERVAIAEFIGRLAFLGLTFFAIYQKFNLFWILSAMVIGNIINFFLLFYFSQRWVKVKPQFNLKIWKNILKNCWPIALSIAFTLMYFRADTIILSLLRPQAEVGIYGATYKILEIAIVFPVMFITLVLPFLTRAWAEKNIDKFKNYLQKSFDFLSLLAVPMIVGVLFLGTRIMTLIAGQEFVESGPVLKILIIATAIIFIGGLFTHIIVAIEKQKQMLKYYLFAAIIALAGYLIFIPRYSYYAAAYITIIAELIIAISAFIIVRRATKISPKLGIVPKSILASLVMSIPLYFLKSWNLFAIILIASITYFITLYYIKGFSKEMIREIIKLKS